IGGGRARTHAAVVPPGSDPFWDLSEYLALTAGNRRPLRIGANSDGGDRFLGLMRRARLWNRALTPEEVAGLAADPSGGLEGDPALVADYRLTELRDGVCRNAAGEALEAKAVGEVRVEEGALRFTGEGYLEVSLDPRLQPQEAYTLDAWVCPEELPEMGARIIDKVTAGVDDGYLLDTCPRNSLRLITEQGVVGFDARLSPGEWAHVAGAFDATGELRLYVNGRLVASTPARERRGPQFARFGAFYRSLAAAGLAESYEALHARLIVDYVHAIHERERLKAEGKLSELPPLSQHAADRSYLQAAQRLAEGLTTVLSSYPGADDPRRQRVAALWAQTGGSSDAGP
ncbi:MAG: LamG domain-containing protein, partial [Armatimonadetes bacterium]|nr:LamG domain-containing protein [Armatimonadota bacterium]